MAYDPGAIDSALAAAVGDEPALIAELRLAFVEGVAASVTTMESAPDAACWRAAAWQLQGLAASFGAVRLMVLASNAAAGDPGNRLILTQLRRAAKRL